MFNRASQVSSGSGCRRQERGVKEMMKEIMEALDLSGRLYRHCLQRAQVHVQKKNYCIGKEEKKVIVVIIIIIITIIIIIIIIIITT